MEAHERKDGAAQEGEEKGVETDGGYTTDGRGKKRRRGRGAGRRRKGRQSGAGLGEETEAEVEEHSGDEEGASRKKAKLDDDEGLPWKCTVQDGCTKAFQSVGSRPARELLAPSSAHLLTQTSRFRFSVMHC